MFEDMGTYTVLLIFASVVLMVSLVGAYLPMVRRMDARKVHLMVAFSAGIFLGILFFMLLPDVFESLTDGESMMSVVIWIAGGFMVVLLIDVLLKRMHMNTCACEKCHDDDHGHKLTSFSAFAGLAVHAAVDGMVLSVGLDAGGDIGAMALVAIAVHKFVELFALSSTFMLTDIEKRRIFVYMFLFALITPAAAFLSMPVIDVIGGLELYAPLAVATGTFMYVGIYAMLPEAFHERRDSLVSFALVTVGIVVIAILAAVTGG